MSFNINILPISQLKSNNSIDTVNNNIYISEDTDIKAIFERWNTIFVQTEWSEESISNSDIQDEFSTRLIIKIDKKLSQRSDIIHEGLRNNILFVDNQMSNKEILLTANQSKKHSIQQKGIFAEISHDVLNKSLFFAEYDEKQFNFLKNLNSKCRNEFQLSFNQFIDNGKIVPLNDSFSLLYKELLKLHNVAVTQNNHLGSSRDTLQHIIDTIEYLLSIGE